MKRTPPKRKIAQNSYELDTIIHKVMAGFRRKRNEMPDYEYRTMLIRRLQGRALCALGWNRLRYQSYSGGVRTSPVLRWVIGR